MNLVVMSYCGPFDRYVIQQVQRRWPIRCIVRPVWTPAAPQESQWSKFRKAPATVLGRYASRCWADSRERHFDQALSRRLAVDLADDALPAPCVDIPHREINRSGTSDLLKELNTDVLLVCAAPLLKPSIFTLPTVGTINVHRGISPYYRGEHTLFWPLYFRDYEQLGVTLHCIDRGTDTGPVLAQGYPRLEPDDTLVSVTAKAAHLAAELLVELLDTAHRGQFTGHKHQQSGRLFLAQDRRPRHDKLYWARRTLLGERLPQRPQRKRLYNCGEVPAGAPSSVS